MKTIINQYNNQTKRTQKIEGKKIEKKIARETIISIHEKSSTNIHYPTFGKT